MSKIVWVLAGSGTPSKNFSVPIGVCISFGAAMPGGTGVVYL